MAILSKLKTEKRPSLKDLEIDTQLIDKIIKLIETFKKKEAPVMPFKASNFY